MMPRVSPSASPARYEPWRHRSSVTLAAASVLLLAAGGLVTGTGSGLAVPDWPLSFGQLFPPMVGGVLYEHGHRLIAGTVGLLTIALTIWFHIAEPRRRVRVLAYLALGVVVLQGILGGVTVLLRLPVAVSAAHACLAQVFFCLVVTLALVTSRTFVEPRPAASRCEESMSLFRLASLSAALVFCQLALGAVMRHSGAGLAIPDVPLAFGRVIPPIVSFEIAIHFAHRVGAVLTAGAIIWTAVCALRRRVPGLTAPALLATGLVTVQILLGVTSVVTRLAVLPTTVHLVVGALLLATLVVLALLAARGAGRRFAPRVAPAAAEGVA